MLWELNLLVLLILAQVRSMFAVLMMGLLSLIHNLERIMGLILWKDSSIDYLIGKS